MSEQEHLGRPHGGFSRRAFLKGSSAAAAATAMATSPALAEAQAVPVVSPGGTKTVTLNVNGKDQKIAIENRTTLLEALRYGLGLTGAKPVDVTDDATGGATVLLDGKPIAATNKLALQCAGHKVTTVESLGGAKPDAVATAFVKHDAMQCGFCTPGFVMGVRAFLDKNPDATEEDIRQGLNGNLCRCGTYANVIQAALEVVKGGKGG